MGQLENTVELLGYYGSDETIACSAWTSTSRELTEGKRERIGKLINMLWRDEHETPFEKASVHFLINVDQATHIHLLKHRMSSFNGESARYKELKEDKYYLPQDWDGINTFKCGIYETRPDVCAAYNCFTAANGMKRNPEYFDFIKGLIERVHGTDPYKRRTEESKEQDK